MKRNGIRSSVVFTFTVWVTEPASGFPSVHQASSDVSTEVPECGAEVHTFPPKLKLGSTCVSALSIVFHSLHSPFACFVAWLLNCWVGRYIIPMII